MKYKTRSTLWQCFIPNWLTAFISNWLFFLLGEKLYMDYDLLAHGELNNIILLDSLWMIGSNLSWVTQEMSESFCWQFLQTSWDLFLNRLWFASLLFQYACDVQRNGTDHNSNFHWHLGFILAGK